MLRYRFLKQKLPFLFVIAFLFLLNHYFVGQRENGEAVSSRKKIDETHNEELKDCAAQEHQCVADNGKPMKCWKDATDVFFPFSFIRKRFDVTGKASRDEKSFEMFTSYSKIRLPEGPYDPKGPFGHFATYSVETRERVRCISGASGVPMSTQWDPKPYYYPIQIAQYGLQHYSRLKTANFSHSEVVLGRMNPEWKGAAGMDETSERLFYRHEEVGPVVNITAAGSLSNSGAYVYLDKTPDLHIISLKWLPIENASFTILVKLRENDLLVLLNYVFGEDDRCVWNDDEKASISTGQVSFSFCMGAMRSEWQKVSRDVLVDAARALSSGATKKKSQNWIFHPGDLFTVSIGFRGRLTVKQEIIQSNEQHLDAFLSAAEWFVRNQDEQGGWSVPVERAIAERRLVLAPGWHSAMAQGHGLSLLTRAFSETKEEKFLTAALKAIDLFNKSSEEGGVQNEIFGFPWYEEYPTLPGSFVLNGFLYSLIGLYDFSELQLNSDDNEKYYAKLNEAKKLYDVGVASLKALLPLFDTGSGSIYDLRHVALDTAPNLARWDYHGVHVYLLKWIANIENDAKLEETVRRWVSYAYGKRAKHN
ncbi:unnamed protein product [Caenorhabditis auriculariae]|uniref:heparosan-N-sulfate-glucuronate 5-epimerase n=1 Tax=Caenorhabditis auriculariae TaxID=2777116 RepID=A0A8S1GZC1_9PELO|nr:unnamed protein product [Caenorhabditis auriculariae]